MFVTVWSPYTLLNLHSMLLASHLTHTPCRDKCSSLLTLESGQLDCNQSFWCDNGFVEIDLQLCFKKRTFTNHTQILQLKNPTVVKQWQRDECRSVASCGFGKWVCVYMTDICVLLSPKKNCFPIFLPRSCDIYAILYLPTSVIHPCSSVCGQTIYWDITKCDSSGYLVFCVMLSWLCFQHWETFYGMPFNTFFNANLSYFLSNLYVNITYVILQFI